MTDIDKTTKAVVLTLLSFLMLSSIPAVKLAPLNFSVVVFTGILDWIIFGHVPNMLSFLGIILVIAGGILAIVHTKDNKSLKSNWH